MCSYMYVFKYLEFSIVISRSELRADTSRAASRRGLQVYLLKEVSGTQRNYTENELKRIWRLVHLLAWIM